MTTVKSLLATSCVKITFETGMEAILNTKSHTNKLPGKKIFHQLKSFHGNTCMCTTQNYEELE